MTTVAWDGKTLACDRQSTVGTLRTSISKLVVTKKFVVAGAGNCVEVKLAIEWLLDKRKKKPELEDVSLLLVDVKTGKCVFMDHLLVALEVNENFAIGSGAEVAIGAMDAGMDAVEAVQVACNRDIFSGMGVDSYTWGEK